MARDSYVTKSTAWASAIDWTQREQGWSAAGALSQTYGSILTVISYILMTYRVVGAGFSPSASWAAVQASPGNGTDAVVLSPKLTVGFSQSSYILTTYRVVAGRSRAGHAAEHSPRRGRAHFCTPSVQQRCDIRM